MPKTKRDYLKRNIAAAILEIEEAGRNVIDLHDAFKDVHPEDAELLSFCIQGLISIKDVLSDFAMKSWGHVPENWEAWRGQSKLIGGQVLPDELSDLIEDQ